MTVGDYIAFCADYDIIIDYEDNDNNERVLINIFKLVSTN